MLEAVFAGEIFQNGMVCNMDEIDIVLQEQIHDRFDHKYLNEDVPPFNNETPLIPTCENILFVMWNLISGEWDRLHASSNRAGGAHLHKLILHETAKNVFEYSPKERGTIGELING